MDRCSGGRDAGAGADDGRALHARLLQRDPTATADLAVIYLESLCDWLARAFRHVDCDLLETVATDLILALAVKPEQYDPDRLDLAAYLRMAARGDVSNALQREGRRAARLVSLEAVELSPWARNNLVEGPADPADLVAEAEAIDPETIASIRPHFDDTEWEVVQLMLEGERRTAVYVPILGLGHLSTAEQERIVKQTKDRLGKRLRRLAPKVRRGD